MRLALLAAVALSSCAYLQSPPADGVKYECDMGETLVLQRQGREAGALGARPETGVMSRVVVRTKQDKTRAESLLRASLPLEMGEPAYDGRGVNDLSVALPAVKVVTLDETSDFERADLDAKLAGRFAVVERKVDLKRADRVPVCPPGAKK